MTMMAKKNMPGAYRNFWIGLVKNGAGNSSSFYRILVIPLYMWRPVFPVLNFESTGDLDTNFSQQPLKVPAGLTV